MNANAMPVLENKMVERAYPLRRIVTEYARIIIAFRNRTFDHPVYGQDIAANKMERISAPTENTRYCEIISHRKELNLWR